MALDSHLRRWAVYIYFELPFPIILSALWCELCSLLPASVCFDCPRGKKRLSFDERPVSYVTLWHQHKFTWSIFRSMRTHLQHTNRNRRLLLFRGQDEEIVFVSQIIWVKGEQLGPKQEHTLISWHAARIARQGEYFTPYLIRLLRLTRW